MTILKDTIDLEDEKLNAETSLRKIHFKRLKKDDDSIRDNKFLHEQYLKTNDVRFFNELLWLNNNAYVDLSKKHFYQNLNEFNTHVYNYSEEFKSCLKTQPDDITVNETDFLNKKICLIGLPFHFRAAFKKLKKLKADVEVVNVVYHPSLKTKLLLNNKIIRKFYEIYFGSDRYTEIQVKEKSEIKTINLEKQFDVGFHKLSFIISDHLIKQFKLGLINDHWGALPLFKGRSTLNYSRLFGADLIITNHLIKKEIDSGKILLYSKIDPKKIKSSIYFGLGDRIVKSISLLCRKNFKDIDNTKGEMFYEMHPFLINHIKTSQL